MSALLRITLGHTSGLNIFKPTLPPAPNPALNLALVAKFFGDYRALLYKGSPSGHLGHLLGFILLNGW